MNAITSETMNSPQPHGSSTMVASNSLELDSRPSIDDDDEVSKTTHSIEFIKFLFCVASYIAFLETC